jgi:hypothetical protein
MGRLFDTDHLRTCPSTTYLLLHTLLELGQVSDSICSQQRLSLISSMESLTNLRRPFPESRNVDGIYGHK